MAKHTPGPWEYLPAEACFCGAITTKTGWICEFLECPSPEDARLIAAAPELLEALKRAVETTYSDKLREEWWALITKAKGGAMTVEIIQAIGNAIVTPVWVCAAVIFIFGRA